MKRVSLPGILILFLLATLSGCERPQPEVTIAATVAPLIAPPTPPVTPYNNDGVLAAGGSQPPPTPEILPSPTLAVPSYEGTPTPDPTPAGSGGGQEYQAHVVAAGETLNSIAQRYGSSVEELMTVNNLVDGDLLSAGQTLRVPIGALVTGPSYKLIPDSELVYGPGAVGFDVERIASRFGGYLVGYEGEVEGHLLSGPQIVQLVADRFSVNPRLLLAALEFRAGWVTQSHPAATEYPMGKLDPRYAGLYHQLRWAADKLNWGYYGRAEGGLSSFLVGDTTRVAFAADVNDGTTGVQFWLGAHDGATYESWLYDNGPSGFISTYTRLFGNPFGYTVDPLWPSDLQQPTLALPWAEGETWYFTGGPHGGWASGSAWAALDFVPAHEQLGCYPSDAWARAMAPGIVTRSNFGAVVVDLEEDGYTGSGWAVIYMHLEEDGRVATGTRVSTGDPLGHPSCEGGFSNGTHVHIARTYNGRWVAADGPIPFVMGGWTSQGLGREYDGRLIRGEEVKEACECREEINAITAP